MKKIFSLSVVLPLLLAFKASNVKGQCPADPVACIPNTITASLPDTLFFCEGVTDVVIDPKITSAGVNFSWYKKNSGGTWDNLFSNGSNYKVSSSQSGSGNYAVCWQTGITGCYKSGEVVVATKSFSEQLAREKEFELPDQKKEVFVCSSQPTTVFTSAGNPKYKYNWSSGSGFQTLTAKNSLFKAPASNFSSYQKGRLSAASFPIDLTITDRASGCRISRSIPLRITPVLGPEYVIKSAFCQTGDELEIRLHIADSASFKPYQKIVSSTLQIGNEPVINIPNESYSKIPSNQLLPNTLGINGIAIDNARHKIDVVKYPFNAATFYPSGVNVKYTVLTDRGCRGEVTANLKIESTAPYVVAFEPTNSNIFCANDFTAYKLRPQPVPGSYICPSAPEAIRKIGTDYFFTPSLAIAPGIHRILFEVYKSPGVIPCSGDGELRITVESAPPLQLVGRRNVCPGSINIEYKDMASHSPMVTKSWRIVNTSGTSAAGVTVVPYGSGDSIRVNFPNPYAAPDKKVVIIGTNDNQGCTATSQIQVNVNQFAKAPLPIGSTTACLGFNILEYVSITPPNSSSTYSWKVTNGTYTNIISNGSKIRVLWDANAAGGSRTLSFIELSPKADGTQCQIESEPLQVNFVNPPIAAISNPVGQRVCAGATVMVEALNLEDGVVYTWLPDQISGSKAELTIPNSSGPFFTYSLTATRLGVTCPSSTDTKVFSVTRSPGDPIPQDTLTNCFDTNPLLPITIVFSDLSPPPAPGPSVEWLHPSDANNPNINSTTWRTTSLGIYNAKVTDGATGCSTIGSVQIVDDCPNGIFTSDKTNPNKEFKSPEIYPVPTSEKLFVNLSTETSTDATYQMIELSGRVLESGSVNLTNGTNQLEFYVGSLQTGNYLLKLVSDKSVSNLKFVVVK